MLSKVLPFVAVYIDSLCPLDFLVCPRVQAFICPNVISFPTIQSNLIVAYSGDLPFLLVVGGGCELGDFSFSVMYTVQLRPRWCFLATVCILLFYGNTQTLRTSE